MKKPAEVVRIIINRNYPFRGQTCFVMSLREFDTRWSRVVSDFADAGYPGCEALLEESRRKLEAKRAPPPEDFISSAGPKRIEPKKVVVSEDRPLTSTPFTYRKPMEETTLRWRNVR